MRGTGLTESEKWIEESVQYIRRHAPRAPHIGVILGSGLGDFAESIKTRTEISTHDIPHYPRSTVEGHKGKLVFTSLSGKDLLLLQGRVHFYESDSLATVLYPIRVAHSLGVRTLIVTNAAGAVNRSFLAGDLMIITDHLNLTNAHPIAAGDQQNRDYSPYSNHLIQKAISAAERSGILVRSGVYAGLKGPSYETAAEIEMISRMGGDAVGMSTVLEVSLASQLGMEVLGISCITNLGTGISPARLSHSEVTEVGNRVKETFARLVSSTIALI